MKRLNKKGGFTLIELLVVIAIIGILSSIVLVSLNSARQKGVAARVQGEAEELRTQIESNNDGTYYWDLGNTGAAVSASVGQTTFTKASSAFQTTATDIGGEYSGASLEVFSVAASSASSTVSNGYSIYTNLPSGGYICYDSTGNNKTGTGSHPTAVTSVSACQ